MDGMSNIRNVKSKTLNIVGLRMSGKTSFLIDSMFIHLTDPNLSDDLHIIGSASNISSCKYLADKLIEKLKLFKISHTSHRTGAVTHITVDKKVCNIIPPMTHYLVGKRYDYVFLDNFDHFESGFKKFIDTVVRPNVIVIQTHDEESQYMKDITRVDL